MKLDDIIKKPFNDSHGVTDGRIEWHKLKNHVFHLNLFQCPEREMISKHTSLLWCGASFFISSTVIGCKS